MFIVSYIKLKLNKAEYFCTHIEQLTEHFKYILAGMKHDTNSSLEDRPCSQFMTEQTRAKCQRDYTWRVLLQLWGGTEFSEFQRKHI